MDETGLKWSEREEPAKWKTNTVVNNNLLQLNKAAIGQTQGYAGLRTRERHRREMGSFFEGASFLYKFRVLLRG